MNSKAFNSFFLCFCEQYSSLENVLNTSTAENLNIKGQPVIFDVLLARSTSAGTFLNFKNHYHLWVTSSPCFHIPELHCLSFSVFV